MEDIVVCQGLNVFNADNTLVEMRKTHFVEFVENSELKVLTIGI